MAIVDPTDISGCQIWLAADEIVGLSDGDPVATWVDGSPIAIDFTASGSARPTYKTGILNSLPVVRFDGSANVMSTTSRTPTNWTAFYVLKQSTGDDGGLLCRAGGAFQTRAGLSTDKLLGYFGGSVNESSTLGTPLDQWSIVGFVNGSGNCTYYQGATTYGTVSGGAAYMEVLGSTTGSADFLTGDIAEVAFYDSALAGGDITDLIDYLTDKWFGGGGATAVPVFEQGMFTGGLATLMGGLG